MTAYTNLRGGYLTPQYLMRRNEQWSGSGVTLATYPTLQGSYSLSLLSNAAATIIGTSTYPSDLTDFDGVGFVTYTPDATPFATAHLRIYTDMTEEEHYYEFEWAPSSISGSGTDLYGTGLYWDPVALTGAKYGYDESINFGDWAVLLIPKASFTIHGTPSWGSIEGIQIQLETTAAAQIFIDGISGWTDLSPSEASANSMISNLPEYHWDQEFNDSIMQGAGYELDALSTTLEQSLPQSIPALADRQLDRHEEAMGLPVEPVGWGVMRRRNLVKGLLSMPVTVSEMESALSLATSVAVTVHENYAAYSVDVVIPLAVVPFSAYSACHRLIPAHLGVALSYDTFYAGDLAGGNLGPYFVDPVGDIMYAANANGVQT
jgi:hypothetical protein